MMLAPIVGSSLVVRLAALFDGRLLLVFVFFDALLLPFAASAMSFHYTQFAYSEPTGTATRSAAEYNSHRWLEKLPPNCHQELG